MNTLRFARALGREEHHPEILTPDPEITLSAGAGRHCSPLPSTSTLDVLSSSPAASPLLPPLLPHPPLLHTLSLGCLLLIIDTKCYRTLTANALGIPFLSRSGPPPPPGGYESSASVGVGSSAPRGTSRDRGQGPRPALMTPAVTPRGHCFCDLKACVHCRGLSSAWVGLRGVSLQFNGKPERPSCSLRQDETLRTGVTQDAKEAHDTPHTCFLKNAFPSLDIVQYNFLWRWTYICAGPHCGYCAPEINVLP